MINQNCEDIKVAAEYFASRAFTRGSNSWMLAYSSELIRLTAQKCINSIKKESQNSGDEWENGLMIAVSVIEEQFGA